MTGSIASSIRSALPGDRVARAERHAARVVIDSAEREALKNEIAHLRGLDLGGLRARWHTVRNGPSNPPAMATESC